MFFADMHCDTITNLMDNARSLRNNVLQVDLEKLSRFSAPLQFFAIWLEPQYYHCAYKKTCDYIRFFYDEVEKNHELIGAVKNTAEIQANRQDGKISALLSIEGGECLEGKVERIGELYESGIRAFSLTWNNDNVLACGCNTNMDTGLTGLGREAVEQIGELGMLLDLSHCSERTFWDIADMHKKPLIASHSNTKALRKHQRNLDDKQLRAIADRGGVVGITLFSEFLTYNKRATMDEIISHIDHVVQVAGVDHVGFGCDFEGMVVTPIEIETVADMSVLAEKICAHFGSAAGEKILGGNVLRILNDIVN